MTLVVLSLLGTMVAIGIAVWWKMLVANKEDKVHLLIKKLLTEVGRQTIGSATQHQEPPHGPSLSVHACSSRGFFCQYCTPVNWPEDESHAPRPLCSMSGWINGLDDNIRASLMDAFPSLSPQEVARVSFVVSMSSHSKKQEREKRGMHYGIHVHNEAGEVLLSKEDIISERRVVDRGFDHAFRLAFHMIPAGERSDTL